MIQDVTRCYKMLMIQDVTISYNMLQYVTRLFRTSQVRPFFCLVRQYRLVLKSVWRESFHEWKWLDTGFFLEASWRESISRRITLVDCDVKEKSKTVLTGSSQRWQIQCWQSFCWRPSNHFFDKFLIFDGKLELSFRCFLDICGLKLAMAKNHKTPKTGIGYYRL